jgi:hypothetical protein
MPAVSKQQQKLMGIVRALQTGAMKPSKASKQAQAMAKSMKKSDVKDFAATKHKGLPKKVKKEEMTLEIPKMYMVRKPMEGLTAEKMVCEINPLEGIQPLNVNVADVHSVHATPEDAQQIAAEAYQKYCDEAIALEEKKDTTSGKIKKAIDQLEKKRKEHLDMAKEDPKSAAKHKEHIAKIATQIDDLMTKLERIEKSKKEIKKQEDKKELKEAFEVIYTDQNVRGSKKFSDQSKAMRFAKQLIAQGAKEVDVFRGPVQSTADTDKVIAWYGDRTYMDNMSKKDPKLAAKKIK